MKHFAIDRPNQNFNTAEFVALVEARGPVVAQISQELATGKLTLETVDPVDAPTQAQIEADLNTHRNRDRVDWS